METMETETLIRNTLTRLAAVDLILVEKFADGVAVHTRRNAAAVGDLDENLAGTITRVRKEWITEAVDWAMMTLRAGVRAVVVDADDRAADADKASAELLQHATELLLQLATDQLTRPDPGFRARDWKLTPWQMLARTVGEQFLADGEWQKLTSADIAPVAALLGYHCDHSRDGLWIRDVDAVEALRSRLMGAGPASIFEPAR